MGTVRSFIERPFLPDPDAKPGLRDSDIPKQWHGILEAMHRNHAKLQEFDPDTALAYLQRRREGWQPMQMVDELMDGKPVTTFALYRDKRYLGVLHYVSDGERQGYLVSAIGIGTLNETAEDGRYLLQPLPDAAATLEIKALRID